jgi:proteasome assembly chaperone (PAC2) family protein
VDELIIDEIPTLTDPIAIIAFEGWNDAGSSASGAARFLTWRLGARSFARIDPEGFFSFTDTRPEVKMNTRGERVIEWPKNEFSVVRGEGGSRDLVVFIGVEPSMRWRTFTELFTGLLEDLDISLVVSLGALLADVPHTRDARVSGSAVDPNVAENLGLATSRYEGPTGIVGVLSRTMTEAHIDTISLWANVPHYLTSDRYPPGTLALLRRLETLLSRNLDLREMEHTADRFRDEVEAAIADNSEVREYVQRLEAAWDAGSADGDAEATDLPAASDLLHDLERFLRDQQGDR